jgi:hypothetical protein
LFSNLSEVTEKRPKHRWQRLQETGKLARLRAFKAKVAVLATVMYQPAAAKTVNIASFDLPARTGERSY